MQTNRIKKGVLELNDLMLFPGDKNYSNNLSDFTFPVSILGYLFFTRIFFLFMHAVYARLKSQYQIKFTVTSLKTLLLSSALS